MLEMKIIAIPKFLFGINTEMNEEIRNGPVFFVKLFLIL